MGKRAKRAFDVGVAALLVVVLLPFMLLAALGVWLSLRTSPFFVQRRVGHRGRSIRIVKLRTMFRSTPSYATKDTLGTVAMPRFCKFLRRTHLDELPQLFLVLSGKLSLVGPRPRMPDEYEPVPTAYRTLREQVPQGCTGLWQISVASDDMPHADPTFDAFYVTHWSVRLDLWILARTMLVMLRLRDPITVADVPTWALGTGYPGTAIPLDAIEALEALEPAPAVHHPLEAPVPIEVGVT